ncbi:MAG: MoxR family ATPase [Bacteroidetes bacterium]|jgi:MoxR-like ATPase|nr:MoxR family ATPase [Bacteroidota bacterium]
MTPEEALAKTSDLHARLLSQVGKVVIGQDEIIEHLTIALLCRGHVLLVGVPGLAKTLLIRTMAEAIASSFSRIQFTPDLMPGDITGAEIIEEDRTTGKRAFRFVKGPVFANIVLADEINRTPPKTQSALLEAMQEQHVTAAGQTFDLPAPFFVLATQNPIEQEGTYPLPEAQLDRFMFNLWLDYPSEVHEIDIVKSTTGASLPTVEPVIDGDGLLALQAVVREAPVTDHVVRYAVKLVRATRPGTADAPADVNNFLRYGAGPRASQFLVLGAKARALLFGRATPSVDDVKAVAISVLRHRIVTNFTAEAEGITPADLIGRLVAQVQP